MSLAIQQEMQRYVDAGDFSFAGDRMLDLVLERESGPDDVTRFLDTYSADAARRLLKTPLDLPFPCALRERLQPGEEKVWQKYGHARLIMMAYLLGAKSDRLPPPHNVFVHRMNAGRQAVMILTAECERFEHMNPMVTYDGGDHAAYMRAYTARADASRALYAKSRELSRRSMEAWYFALFDTLRESNLPTAEADMRNALDHIRRSGFGVNGPDDLIARLRAFAGDRLPLPDGVPGSPMEQEIAKARKDAEKFRDDPRMPEALEQKIRQIRKKFGVV